MVKMANEWKCSKCGSTEFRKRSLNILGTTGLRDHEKVTGYICNKCGYVEFYAKELKA